MVNTRMFKPDDAYAVRSLRETAANQINRNFCVMLASKGPCWTLEREGAVLGVGGLMLKGNGLARLWGLVSNDLTPAEGMYATRLTVRLLRQSKWLGVERIESLTEANWRKGERTLRVLGFAVLEGGDVLSEGVLYRLWERAP